MNELLTVYLYLSDDEWGIVGDHKDPLRISHYWPQLQPPTQDQRAAALQRLGYELASAWIWRESPTATDTHSLYAVAQARKLSAEASAEPSEELETVG